MFINDASLFVCFSAYPPVQMQPKTQAKFHIQSHFREKFRVKDLQ